MEWDALSQTYYDVQRHLYAAIGWLIARKGWWRVRRALGDQDELRSIADEVFMRCEAGYDAGAGAEFTTWFTYKLRMKLLKDFARAETRLARFKTLPLPPEDELPPARPVRVFDAAEFCDDADARHVAACAIKTHRACHTFRETRGAVTRRLAETGWSRERIRRAVTNVRGALN